MVARHALAAAARGLGAARAPGTFAKVCECRRGSTSSPEFPLSMSAVSELRVFAAGNVRLLIAEHGSVRVAEGGCEVDASSPERLALRVGPQAVLRVPPSHCNVHVESGDGDVEVEAVKEAGVEVRSVSGHVHVGKVQGPFARIATGGRASGTLVAAEVHVSAGELALQRVMGRRLQLSSQGPASVKYLYAEEALHLECSGGALSIGTLHAPNGADLECQGGACRVGSVDGSTSIRTAGGAVEFLKVDSPGVIRVQSGGGDVTCKLAATTDVDVDLRGGHVDVSALAGDFDLEGSSGDGRVQGRLVSRGAFSGSQGRLLPCSRPSKVEIDAGAGRVRLLRSSWIDAVAAGAVATAR